MDVACQKTDGHDKRRAEDNDVTREKEREIEFVIGGRSRFYGIESCEKPMSGDAVSE